MSRHIDKEALVAAVMSSKELNNEQKSQLIRLIREQKKYGLVWEDSTEDAWEKMKTSIPILKEVDDKRILNDKAGEHYPNHAIIEADNLHALIALCYTHAGSFDVMYFDPPYNTGKEKEFKYNDKWVDSEDEYRHSKWLSFMNKRLRLAKSLLKDTGIIFISIDDNEIAQLKSLCDEIFSNSSNPKLSNCLGVLVWDLGSGTQAGHFTRAHEYVLAYAKDKDKVKNFSGGEGTIDHSALKKISKKNPPVEFTFKAGAKFLAPDGTELKGKWGDSETTELINGRMVCENQKLKYDVTLKAGFAMVNQMKSWFDGKDTVDSKGQHVVEFYFNKSGVLHYIKDKSIINPPTIIKEVGSTKQGTNDLEDAMRTSGSFDYPKPLSLVSFLLNLQDKTIRILDIFAGSGTTLHATMQLNAEDGGHRQCILVTNNENNICEEVTYERNKRVIEGYTTPKGEQVAGLKDNNLRYYKLSFAPREKTDRNMLSLAIKSIPLLCIKNDIYQEMPQLGHIENMKKGYRYFKEGERQMLVILDADLIGDIVKELEQMEVAQPIKTYVFTTGHYPYTEDFQSVKDKVDLYPIPHSIYGACEKHMPPMDDMELQQPEGVTLSAEEENLSMDDYNKED